MKKGIRCYGRKRQENGNEKKKITHDGMAVQTPWAERLNSAPMFFGLLVLMTAFFFCRGSLEQSGIDLWLELIEISTCRQFANEERERWFDIIQNNRTINCDVMSECKSQPVSASILKCIVLNKQLENLKQHFTKFRKNSFELCKQRRESVEQRAILRFVGEICELSDRQFDWNSVVVNFGKWKIAGHKLRKKNKWICDYKKKEHRSTIA